MPALAAAPAPPRTREKIPELQNGDHLCASEFLRRFEAMPDLKKAELIEGVVFIMPSPVRVDQHGEPDSLVQTWLGNYAIATPGVKPAVNSTVRLGPDDVPQPDGLLRLVPERGGRARIDAKGYLEGAPDLAVEIAASSASLDARKKLVSYRRAGVREYLLWRTGDGAVDWWVLEEDEYRPVVPPPTARSAAACSLACGSMSRRCSGETV
jgi:Uma2 family endonuclease